MNQSFRNHLELTTELPHHIIDEVCEMFANEATSLIDALSNIQNPEVRTVVLESLRSYHKALDTNTGAFPQIATIMSNPGPAANNESYLPKAA
jgi:hypothetical protein